MINKVIEKPQLIGCLNCSPIPKVKLDKDKEFIIYGIVSLKIAGEKEKYFMEGIYQGKELSANRIMKKWGKLIKRRHHAYLSIIRMMHSETYEYDKKTNEWYLIDQGLGMA
jgi:hypothetical protein